MSLRYLRLRSVILVAGIGTGAILGYMTATFAIPKKVPNVEPTNTDKPSSGVTGNGGINQAEGGKEAKK